MFDRAENRQKTVLRYLFATFLNQQIFDWLLKNRARDWIGFLRHENVESMKNKDEPWIKRFIIIGTQDFLDAIENRKRRKYQNKKIIPKNPYLFQVLNLLEIEYNPSERREELERKINEKIEKSGILAKG